MNKIDQLKRKFNDDIEIIENYATNASQINELIQWMLTTDADHCTFLDPKYCSYFTNIDGLVTLVEMIDRAVRKEDNCEITFATFNGVPKIIFDNPLAIIINNNLIAVLPNSEKRDENAGLKHDIKILDIAPNEFPSIFEKWQSKK